MKRLIDWLGYIVLEKSHTGHTCLTLWQSQWEDIKELEKNNMTNIAVMGILQEHINLQERSIENLEEAVTNLLERNQELASQLNTVLGRLASLEKNTELEFKSNFGEYYE